MHAFVPSGAQPASDASSQLKAPWRPMVMGRGKGVSFWLLILTVTSVPSPSDICRSQRERERERGQEGGEEWGRDII